MADRLGTLMRFAAEEPSSFYSKAQHVLNDPKTPAVAHPQDWFRMEPNKKTGVPEPRGILPSLGVKPEEIKWTGLQDHLAQAKGPVKKSDLAAAVRPPEIKEVWHTHLPWTPSMEEEYEGMAEAEENGRLLPHQQRQLDEMAERREAATNFHSGGKKAETKYDEWQMPGGINYRELLLALPKPDFTPEEIDKRLYQTAKERGFKGTLQQWSATPKDDREHFGFAFPQDYQMAKWFLQSENLGYKSPHWDEPNVLAHARFNDRTALTYTPEQLDDISKRIFAATGSDASNVGSGSPLTALRKGAVTPLEANQFSHAMGFNADKAGATQKLLHLEELQSDAHQKGRKHGYLPSPERRQQLDQRRQEIEKVGSDATPEQKQEWADIMNELHPGGKTDKPDERVPDMPFKTNWHELLLKKIIDHAVRNNYSGLSWTPGDIQADRYDLSKQVDSIGWFPANGGAKIVGIKIPGKTERLRIKVGKDGIVESFGKDTLEQADGKRLDEVVGKDVAEKIMASHSGELSGEGLQVGGEGMRGFYDRIVPSFLNKYGKRWGAKVGTIQIPAANEDDKRILRLKIRAYPGHPTPVWRMYDPETNAIDRVSPVFNTEAEAKAALADRQQIVRSRTMVEVPHFPITPEMRQAILNEKQAMFDRVGCPERLSITANGNPLLSWMSPSGEIKPLVGQLHSTWLTDNGFSSQKEAFEQGWQRLIPYQDSLYSHNNLMAPNERQLAQLKDLALIHRMNHVIHDSGQKERVLWSKSDRMQRQGQPERFGDAPGYFLSHSKMLTGSPFITKPTDIEMGPHVTPELLQNIFGSVPHPNDLAAAANYVDGMKLFLTGHPNGHLLTSIVYDPRAEAHEANPHYFASRKFYDNGHVHNDFFTNGPESPFPNRGGDIFRAQAEALLHQGFGNVSTDASGSSDDWKDFLAHRAPMGLIGYFYWPKLGYSAKLSPHQIQKIARAGKFGRIDPRRQYDIADLIDKPGFYDWWKLNGGRLDANFDLDPSSRSMQRLRRMTKWQPSKPEGGNGENLGESGGGTQGTQGDGIRSGGERSAGPARTGFQDKATPERAVRQTIRATLERMRREVQDGQEASFEKAVQAAIHQATNAGSSPSDSRAAESGHSQSANRAVRSVERILERFARVAAGKHGDPSFNPGNPTPEMIERRKADPLWQYHRGEIGIGGERPPVGKPNLSRAITVFQRARVAPSEPPEGFAKGHTDQHPWTNGPRGASEFISQYHHQNQITEPMSPVFDEGRMIDRTRRGYYDALHQFIQHARTGDPYRAYAASILGGNRHAIPLLVAKLRERDNPAGWWKGWSDLHRRMEREQGNLNESQVADRIAKIVGALQADPEYARAMSSRDVQELAESGRQSVRPRQGSIAESYETYRPVRHGNMWALEDESGRDFGIRPHLSEGLWPTAEAADDFLRARIRRHHQPDFHPYHVMTDAMQDAGIPTHYTNLIKSELANVLPIAMSKPKGRARFTRPGTPERFSRSIQDEDSASPDTFNFMKMHDVPFGEAEADPSLNGIFADYLSDQGHEAASRLVRGSRPSSARGFEDLQPGWRVHTSVFPGPAYHVHLSFVSPTKTKEGRTRSIGWGMKTGRDEAESIMKSLIDEGVRLNHPNLHEPHFPGITEYANAASQRQADAKLNRMSRIFGKVRMARDKERFAKSEPVVKPARYSLVHYTGRRGRAISSHPTLVDALIARTEAAKRIHPVEAATGLHIMSVYPDGTKANAGHQASFYIARSGAHVPFHSSRGHRTDDRSDAARAAWSDHDKVLKSIHSMYHILGNIGERDEDTVGFLRKAEEQGSAFPLHVLHDYLAYERGKNADFSRNILNKEHPLNPGGSESNPDNEADRLSRIAGVLERLARRRETDSISGGGCST